MEGITKMQAKDVFVTKNNEVKINCFLCGLELPLENSTPITTLQCGKKGNFV